MGIVMISVAYQSDKLPIFCLCVVYPSAFVGEATSLRGIKALQTWQTTLQPFFQQLFLQVHNLTP